MQTLSQAEITRYSRHLLVPQVGLAGQEKLKNTSVLIVGSGGLGSPTALYLAAAGIGRIGLVDFDVVDDSNLQRQIIHDTTWVGKPKVKSAQARLHALNPYIQIDVYDSVFSAANAREVSAPYDILVDGTDNFTTRYLLNDLAVFTGKPYVYGSIFRFEGQVSVFDARRGPCYRCLFPDPPEPGSVQTCSDAGVLGVLPGTIGSLQATEVIKLALQIGEPLIGKLLLYDALEMNMQTIHLRKNPGCVVCGEHPQLHDLIDYEQFCGVPARHQPANTVGDGFDLSVQALAERLRAETPPVLIDVREAVEQQISALPGAILMPLEKLAVLSQDLDPRQEYVLYCRTGVRSTRAVNLLRKAGFVHVRNLAGGINAWAREVDPRMHTY